ncbi:DUF742 domain-containing protein [Streptomyces sp. NPDC050504]|uniref:DUF742 domain-containing protein n=1 Tax=Streptomyces sp. NPDC050504 TaxID=3365618 RepID=UPI0037B1176D
MTVPRRVRRKPLPQSAPPAGSSSHQTEGKAKAKDDGRELERLYVITGGPDGSERARLDLVTMIVACEEAEPSIPPEHSAILRLCQAPLSVAELSAYLTLPFSVVTALLTELLATELVESRAPIARATLPDRSLLEAVMHGLQKL